MPAAMLTTAATLQCPHGGQVQIVSADQKTTAGAQAALATDTFNVSGCPFQIPAVVPIPSPCIQIVWMATDVKATVGGQPTLSLDSVGMCMAATGCPQGPVVIVSSPAQAQSS